MDFIDGQDLQITPRGVDIIALADGTVSNVFYHKDGGWIVVVAHTGRIVTTYHHLRANVPVKRDDEVKKGQVLGVMGKTVSRLHTLR